MHNVNHAEAELGVLYGEESMYSKSYRFLSNCDQGIKILLVRTLIVAYCCHGRPAHSKHSRECGSHLQHWVECRTDVDVANVQWQPATIVLGGSKNQTGKK